MPQQQDYIWDIEYNGFRFKLQSPTQPTKSQVHAAWVDSTIRNNPVNIELPDLDIGDAETDFERADRNAEEVGSLEPDQAFRDATWMERATSAFWGGAIPHFGLYKSPYSPPDESSELWAEAVGGLTGAVAGFAPVTWMTGGMGTPAQAANVVHKMNRVNQLRKLASVAQKRGNLVQSQKLLDRAAKTQLKSSKLFKTAIANKTMPLGRGLLGKSNVYKNAIVNLADKNPKLARAVNLYVSNAAAFGAYGQTKMLPWEKFENRFKQLGKDTMSSLIFSAAGLPTVLGATGKLTKLGVEPALIFGAGMFSDYGQTDMTMEERMIHGTTFLGFHLARMGFKSSFIKERLGTAWRLTDPSLSEAQLRTMKDSPYIANMIKNQQGHVLDNPKYMTFSEKKNPENIIELMRIEKPPKDKPGKFRAVYRELDTGRVASDISGDSRRQVVTKFHEKFSKNVPQLDRRKPGKPLTPDQKKNLAVYKNQEKTLREALESSRGREVVEIERADYAGEIKDPFKIVEGIYNVQNTEKQISGTKKDIADLKAAWTERLKKGEIPPGDNYYKTKYRKELASLERVRIGQQVLLDKAKENVSVRHTDFNPEMTDIKIGDYVRIPRFDENTSSFDYTKPGIGRFVGRMDEYAPGDVVAPEWMKREPTRSSDYFKNVPVFEIRTHGGSRTTKVAIGGNIPGKVLSAIETANRTDRPTLEYLSENKEAKHIQENPIVSRSSISSASGPIETLDWNPKSSLFKELFSTSGIPVRGRDAKTRMRVRVSEEVQVPLTGEKRKEYEKMTGFKRSAEMSILLAEARDVITSYESPGYHGGRWGAKTKPVHKLADFIRPFNKALRLGFKGDAKMFEKIVREGTPTETGVMENEYYAYSPANIKRLKISPVEQAFPEGVPTFEGAIRLEASRLQDISKKLEKQRAREREKFKWFRGVDASEWPDMNKMNKNMPLTKDVFESYPELDPLQEKPFSVNFTYDYRTKDKIETKRMRAMRNGTVARFETKEEAENFANSHWVSAEAIENLISNKIAQRNSLKGEEALSWERRRGLLKKAQRVEKISDEEYKFMLREFFPESNGSSKNMTYNELTAATALISSEGNTPIYNNLTSSSVPPADLMTHIEHKWRGIIGRNSLPVYTVLGMAKSRTAKTWSEKGINAELTRQLYSGRYVDFLSELKKTFNLSTADMRKLTPAIDKKWEDFYDHAALDKYPMEDIVNVHRRFEQMVVAEMLVPNRVEVRDASTVNMKHNPIFEAYDKFGKRIELANGYDAVRLAEGIDFLDSRGNIKMPSMKKDFIEKGIDITKTGERNVPEGYLKSLRRFNEETGKQEDGWFIIGDTRYIPIWRKNGEFKQLQIAGKNRVETKDGKFVETYNRDGEPGFNHQITKDFLKRITTEEFRNLIGSNENFRLHTAEWVARHDPEFVKMQGSMTEKIHAAVKRFTVMDKFLLDTNGVFGTMYSRIANLPPVIAFEKGYKLERPISLDGYKDVKGKPITKNSTVIDTNGEFKKIGKIIDVYERDYTKIMYIDAQKTAHIASTFKHFGKGGALNEDFLKTKADLALETNERFADWAHDAVKLQVNAVQKSHLYDKPLRGFTSFVAQIGLSSPFSGEKNIILGQTSNATVFGFRHALDGFGRFLRDPRGVARATRKIGGTEAGMHELASGRILYQKYSPGMMYPSELVNRMTSQAMAYPVFKAALDNLNKKKNIMNVGVSERTSMRFLSDVFKLTDAEIKDAKELGSERIHERPEYLTRAEQLSHLITQGGPTLPFVPRWMGKNWSKPLTLFYRIAYRMAENVTNSVFKPLIADGNPVPLMRYLTLLPIAGAAIYYSHWAVLGKELRNLFKTTWGQYAELALRAEGLAVFSNAFDEYGNVLDSYTPVVYKVAKSLATNILAGIFYQTKFKAQALDDFVTESVVLYNHSISVMEKLNAPINKKFRDSRRRQAQFEDEYFRNNKSLEDSDYVATKRTPYYRAVREAFWSDNNKDKARHYYAALNMVTHHEINKDPSLKKTPKLAIKAARKSLKTIISNQRPIPTSWRKPTTGLKSRFQVYWSKLTPELRKEEQFIESEYEKKYNEFWASVQKYRPEFQFDPFPGPNSKVSK